MKLYKRKSPTLAESALIAKTASHWRLGKPKRTLEALPFSVLDRIVDHLDAGSVLNIRTLSRKLRICASRRLWHTLILTNLPTRRRTKELCIYVNKLNFRSFFQEVYMGRLDLQLQQVKRVSVVYKEDQPYDEQASADPDKTKNLNYVPIQNFFHWFLSAKMTDSIYDIEKVYLSVNIATKKQADSTTALCWAKPKARVAATFWLPGGECGVTAGDLIVPNMVDLEFKCDLMNYDEHMFMGDWTVPKKCEVFRIGIEDQLRVEHRIKVDPQRPSIKAETLQRWFRKCGRLHSLELAYVDIYNPHAIDWTPPCFAHMEHPALELREVEFFPEKQAVVLNHVNLLERRNIYSRPLMELLAPHIVSVVVAASQCTPEQIVQLGHWFKFHRQSLHKITLLNMSYYQLLSLLPDLAALKYRMVDIMNPVADSTCKFEDLAPHCLDFAVLMVHMKNIGTTTALNFLRILYENSSRLQSVRIMDGPFTRDTLPDFVLHDSKEFRLIESPASDSQRRTLLFDKPISHPSSPRPNTPVSSLHHSNHSHTSSIASTNS